MCPPWQVPTHVNGPSEGGSNSGNSSGNGSGNSSGNSGGNSTTSSDAYSLRAPWSKDGEDADHAMKHVLEARQARKERYRANCAHDRALGSTPQRQMEATTRRYKAYRASESAARVDSARSCGEEREKTHTEVRAQQRKLAAEAKSAAEAERAAAGAAAQRSLNSKRQYLGAEKQRVRDERTRSVQAGRTSAEQTSQLRKARNQASVQYKTTLAKECRDRGRHTAETLRQERLQAEERAKAHVALHHQRKEVRAAWMVEEKEEQQLRKNDLICERAEAFQARAAVRAAAKSERDTHAQRAEQQRRQGGKASVARASDRQAWDQDRKAGRNQAVAQLQASHMKAMERKQEARQELEARTVEPLRRRSQFAKERNANEKSERRVHEARMQGEQLERQKRRAEVRAHDASLANQPFVLG